MKSKGGRPKNFKTPKEMLDKFLDYYKSCFITEKNKEGVEYQRNIKPVTLIGATNFLDISKDTFAEYSHKPEFSDTVKKIKQICEEFLIEQMFYNPRQVSMIFLAKNNFGYTDTTEQKVTVTDNKIKFNFGQDEEDTTDGN
jgi:hypothetical protein